MAKKVFMIAPFEAMTGNLSGAQTLEYAENNNPAYEAPNGTQYARNYKTRYVGARRGSDGLVYFSVRQRSAAVLNGKSRTAMGLISSTAAIKSSVQALPATSLGLVPWTHIVRCHAAYKEANPSAPDAKSVDTYFAERVRRLLRYKQASYLFHESGVAGGWTLFNPYDLGATEALQIKTSTWLKFADLFLFIPNRPSVKTGFFFFIDSVRFVAPLNTETPVEWAELDAAGINNLNWKASLTGIEISSEEPQTVTYLGLQVYTDTAAVEPGDTVEAIKYSTIAPEE